MGKVLHGHARKRGAKRSPTYVSWNNMWSRARGSYPFPEYYRDKGVTVCERWSKFANFLADMGERPPGTSLDRIDGSAGYSPENCRWATPKQQVANTVTRKDAVIWEGKRVKEWAKEWGITYRAAHKRIGRRMKNV